MRLFTHHALKPPVAKPLNDWLDRAGPVSALMQTARELAQLEGEVLALLPPGLRAGIAVAGVKRDNRGNPQEQTLLLLAAHGAAAARVRQVVPTLLARLQERGSTITAIRVRIQPDISRRGEWDAPPAPRPRTGRMTATGLASLGELAASLPESPLRDALQTLLSHHR